MLGNPAPAENYIRPGHDPERASRGMRKLRSPEANACGMTIGRAPSPGLSHGHEHLAALRLLPMSDRDKDVEILALSHQITVLERRTRHRHQSQIRT
ncbi:hypothetical protein GCM10022224_090510 [Nonomuraea antimicrobica]|uniref:Uncharacterized protein n=1 Tax=Nonomuraea antimicrobica TaxID=561173 RepID=A0ABP7DYX9_9ACTN